MTRMYRAMLTAGLLGGLAMPAFAQTPAPAAPPSAAPEATAPAAPAATAPAPDAAPQPAKTAKPAVHKHHRAATKHKTASKESATTPAAQNK